MHQEIVAVNAKIASFLITKKTRVDEMRKLVQEVKSRYLAVEGLFGDDKLVNLETVLH